MIEVFKEASVPGYMVSNTGRVVSLKRGIEIKQYKNQKGYVLVALRDSTNGQRQVKKLVHRLVAEAFLGSPPTELHEVDHKDQNKENNFYTNLRWATRAEQQRNSPNNVKVLYNGEYHILKDACTAIGKRTLYSNILSRVNRGKGTHQEVFDAALLEV